MSIWPTTTEEKQDLTRAIMCLVVIIVCAFLVGFGKVDVNVFILVISSITSYYLGKSSSQGSILK